MHLGQKQVIHDQQGAKVPDATVGVEAIGSSLGRVVSDLAQVPTPPPGDAGLEAGVGAQAGLLQGDLRKRIFQVQSRTQQGVRTAVIDNSQDMHALPRLHDHLRQEWTRVLSGGFGEFPEGWRTFAQFRTDFVLEILNVGQDHQGVHQRILPGGTALYLVFPDALRHGEGALLSLVEGMEGKVGSPAPGNVDRGVPGLPGGATAMAQEASFKAHEVESAAMGANNLDYLGHRVAALAHREAKGQHITAANNSRSGSGLQERHQRTAAEHERQEKWHIHWAAVTDPATLVRGNAILKLIEQHAGAVAQSLGMPGWRSMDATAMYEAAQLREAIAGGPKLGRSGLPRAITKAEAYLAEEKVDLPLGEGGWATLNPLEAHKIEGLFAEVGLSAMYGGRKGHGFWLSETTAKVALRVHAGDFAAGEAARMEGEFHPLASAENHARTGNPHFFTYEDALGALAERRALAVGIHLTGTVPFVSDNL
jgi:hypothetical protein